MGCYFIIGGKAQAFGISVSVTPSARSYLDKSLEQHKTDATDVSCDNKTPPFTMNAPAMLSGVGDAALVWDQCPPHGQYDNTYV